MHELVHNGRYMLRSVLEPLSGIGIRNTVTMRSVSPFRAVMAYSGVI